MDQGHPGPNHQQCDNTHCDRGEEKPRLGRILRGYCPDQGLVHYGRGGGWRRDGGWRQDGGWERRRWRLFVLRQEFSDCGTAARVAVQTSLYRINEFRRKSCGQGDAFGALAGPRRRSLCESLDKRDAESPNVARRGYRAALGF